MHPSPFRLWLVYRGVWGLVGTLSWTTAALYFIRDVGMSPLQLVLAGTALEVAYFLFEVPTGVVADLYSRKRSVVIAAFLSGVAMVMVGAVSRFGIIVAGMALWGVAWTFRSGAEDAWLADEVGPAHLGAAYERGAQVARLAGLAGIAVAVGLALVDLRLPFLVAGGTTVLLAGYLSTAMSESGFVRPARAQAATALGDFAATARRGGRLVRATPLLLIIIGVYYLVGAFEEGFDRLWEAQLLLEVGLPGLGVLGEAGWFGIFGAATLLLSFAIAAPLVRRVEAWGADRLVRLLLLLYAAMVAAALGFALAGPLWLAATAFLATSVLRELAGPPSRTWLNANITDSSVRATLLSITSVAGSFGEWTGGPALGGIGSRWGVRAALTSAALLLAPTLPLFARAARHHGVEPELAQVSDAVG